MSGGHYEYAYGHMNRLVQAIREDIATRAEDKEDPWVKGEIIEAIPPDILTHMEFVADRLEELAMAAHDLEWVMSGDYGYDTLRERCESWKLSQKARETNG